MNTSTTDGRLLRSTPLALALVAGAALSGGMHALLVPQSAAFAQSAPARAPATSIAVVNLQELMDGLSELRDMNKELDATRAQYQAELESLDAQIRALDVELKDNIPADQAMLRAEKSLKLLELRNIKEFRGKNFSELMDARNGDILRRVYAKVLPSVDRFAQREGYDLVLLDDRGITIPDRITQSQMNQLILSKRVLAAAPHIDITQRLVTVLNNEYGTAPAPTP